MSNEYQLIETIVMAAAHISAERHVFILARKTSGNLLNQDDIVFEAIICCDDNRSPSQIHNEFCHRMQLNPSSRRCIRVILPDGLNPGDVRGFRAIRSKDELFIELTR